MIIPEFLSLLDEMKMIHDKKNKDYAARSNPFENFERSAELSSWFDDNIDKSFVNLIGTKLARLATLLNSNDAPNNESIEDSFLDLCTYAALWSSYHKRFMVESQASSVVGPQPNPMKEGAPILPLCPYCISPIYSYHNTTSIGDGSIYHHRCADARRKEMVSEANKL